jgi:hypothetical protein
MFLRTPPLRLRGSLPLMRVRPNLRCHISTYVRWPVARFFGITIFATVSMLMCTPPTPRRHLTKRFRMFPPPLLNSPRRFHRICCPMYTLPLLIRPPSMLHHLLTISPTSLCRVKCSRLMIRTNLFVASRMKLTHFKTWTLWTLTAFTRSLHERNC